MKVRKIAGGSAAWRMVQVVAPLVLGITLPLTGCSSGEHRDEERVVRSADVLPPRETTAMDSAAASRTADRLNETNTVDSAAVPRAADVPPRKAKTIGWATAPRAPLRFVVMPAGNEARYRVREQLVGVDLPSDAVGATHTVTGGIAFDSTGKVIPAESQFVIDASTFTSDRERRDGYVRDQTLASGQYPTIILRPIAVRGLAWPLSPAGVDTFELIGNLTIKGVTRSTTWTVRGRFDGRTPVSSAGTAFTCNDCQLT